MAAALLTGFTEIKRRLSEIPPFHQSGSSNQNDADSTGNIQTLKQIRYTPKSLDYFTTVTSFTRQELKVLYRNFKNDCPNGYVNEETFKSIYGQFFPLGDVNNYAHFLFRAFDCDEDGQINFEQFIITLSTLLRGSLEDRLKWTFRLYDVNDNGYLTREEMALIIKSIYSMLGKGTHNFTEKHCEQHASDIFSKFDTHQNGIITIEEFCDTCSKDESIMASMRVFDDSF